MESSLVLTSTSSTTIRTPQLPKTVINGGSLEKNRFFLKSDHFSSYQKKLSICKVVNKRKSLVVVAAAKKEHKKKQDSHSAVSNPDEQFFTEAVLLKEGVSNFTNAEDVHVVS